ncbi:MAG TPA: ABC transporter permease [Anaerolineae bacterium]|nr:ABC transporter permease [Anaerolineae bacterium]
MSQTETTSTVTSVNPALRQQGWGELLERVGIIIVLVVLIALIAIVERLYNGTAYFFSIDNFSNIARQIPWQAPLALGEFLAILTAGIDLSVGSVLALAMMVTVIAAHAGIPAIPAMLIGLLVGALCGAVNGLSLTRLKLPHPFIPTLAMVYIARGLTNLLSNGTPILRVPWEIRLLGAGNLCLFTWQCEPSSLRIPIPFIVVVVLFVAFGIFLTRTRTGRHIYAVGGNPQAALYSGINVNNILTLVYILSGILAGVGAILLAGRTNSGEPQAGVGAELFAIAAVIIGGASFFGGRGNVLGVFIGLVIMGIIGNGLNILGVQPFWQQVAIGVIILLVATLDVVRRRTGRV